MGKLPDNPYRIFCGIATNVSKELNQLYGYREFEVLHMTATDNTTTVMIKFTD